MQDYTNYKAEQLLLDESFIQYCLGDEEATKQWEQRFDADGQLAEEASKAHYIYHLLHIDVPAEEKKIATGRLRKEINELKNNEIHTAYNGKAPVKKLFRYLAVAAISVGIILTAVLWLKHDKKDQLMAGVPAESFAHATYETVFTAGDNQRREITLPDGSTVILNSGSVLKIAADYNKDTRWLYLDGEAFFSVAKDKERPFVVITGTTATTALGTSFKVRNYDAEKNCGIMLATGKVKVQSLQPNTKLQDVILLPGQQVTVAGSKEQTGVFDQAMLDDWRAMRITFEKATLADIITRLEFYYGVQIKLVNKPATDVAFTGKFSHQPITEVLEAISFTNRFVYSQTGNVVSLQFK